MINPPEVFIYRDKTGPGFSVVMEYGGGCCSQTATARTSDDADKAARRMLASLRSLDGAVRVTEHGDLHARWAHVPLPEGVTRTESGSAETEVSGSATGDLQSSTPLPPLPATAYTDESEHLDGDPEFGAMTVRDIKAWLRAHPDDAGEIHSTELAGKNRKSVLDLVAPNPTKS